MAGPNQKTITVLRIVLCTCAFGWGISAAGIFLPWNFISEQLKNMGAINIPDDPMLNYWLRMTAGAFTFIGILFLLPAWKPRKYFIMLRMLACFMVIEGLLLAGFGITLKCAITFCVDSAFCILTGCLIFTLHCKLRGDFAQVAAEGQE